MSGGRPPGMGSYNRPSYVGISGRHIRGRVHVSVIDARVVSTGKDIAGQIWSGELRIRSCGLVGKVFYYNNGGGFTQKHRKERLFSDSIMEISVNSASLTAELVSYEEFAFPGACECIGTIGSETLDQTMSRTARTYSSSKPRLFWT
jgi:hypothetical protein